MIRPLTCITLLMAACSGLYLYQTKARTLGVDHEIARALKQADATWQRASVLRAEYALLNDPSRLADLASQYLPTLQTTAPAQFSTLADLDHRLPAVGPPPAPPDATPDVTAPVAAAPVPESPEVAHLEPLHREPPREETPRVETQRVETPVAETPRPPPRPVAPAIVAALPKPAPLAPPRVQTPVSRPTALPVTEVAAVHPVPAPAAPAVVRPPPTTPSAFVGSALGMARTMAPRGSDAGGMR
jgi:hypothetical protein